MFTKETENALNDMIQLLCTEIRESIEKRGGIGFVENLPDLLNSLSNLVKAALN